MPIIDTANLAVDHISKDLDPGQIYNGLDCCLTFEIWEKLQTLFNEPPLTYQFERALQGPALEMMLRGFRIDPYERQRGIELLTGEIDRLREILSKMAFAVWGKPLNARSPKQLQEFFYDTLHIPQIWSNKKGVKKLSMDRETLEKIEVYFHARPIVATILAIRETAKKLEVLTSEIDPDGRLRTSINIGATETGRFSSSTSTTGTGTNLQNITPELRRMFIADEGWKLCAIDLEQAESREVGWLCGTLFGDWTYLDSCEGGDLHTTTARLIWPNLGWTGDAKKDRIIADRPFYRHFSYRDMSKRGGHGSNYLGAPWTMSRHLKVPVKFMTDFQERYFDVFPGIPMWHRWVAEQLQTTQQLITPFGRKRHFFGRPGDDTTLREAVAYIPQSSTADRLNLGLYRIWKHFGSRVQVLLQLHDAVYFQYHETDNEREIVEQALELIKVELSEGGRKFVIPGECKVGWNWASAVTPDDVARAITSGKPPPRLNPDGLMKFKGSDSRKRTAILDRML